MGLTRVRLGELLTLVERPNADGIYGIDDVRGVNNLKLMIRTKADVSKRNFTKFQIVKPGEFFFNHRTSRNGSKFSITYNYDNVPHIVTEDYVLFSVADKNILYPGWLYLYVCRAEYDHYVIQNSWGSSTEFFNWEDLCDTVVDLPPIDVQRKYVAIYESMLANQRAYESGLDDVKLACNALLDRCKLSSQRIRVGDCVSEVDRRNGDNRIDCAYGININKEFMPSKASSDDLRNYKLVFPGELAYSSMQTGRDKCIRIALHEGEDSIAVSPAYSILHMKESSALSAEYLMTWFSRPESDRLGWFLSDASIRANLDLDRFLDIEIPVPEFNVQVAITSIYKALRARTAINKRLKTQLREICPILIRGSIEEALKQP
ncbi:type I restriction enzyme, S subunit [Olsenella sp. KH3B4]|uniref:restriction endonuclease subunit S n=1 Tax=Olsenella sp. KH3B4 TaxID=1855394 RepID=UPI0008CD0564|nr:restriction endonuclease subunit S [Olsenella sp. KH3B4]SET02921.1 type I restriction enzyme, S subunit [Olsenella sp. KH3B4]